MSSVTPDILKYIFKWVCMTIHKGYRATISCSWTIIFTHTFSVLYEVIIIYLFWCHYVKLFVFSWLKSGSQVLQYCIISLTISLLTPVFMTPTKLDKFHSKDGEGSFKNNGEPCHFRVL